MKTNVSVGNLLRLLAGIVYGTFVASEVLGYLVLLGNACLELVDGETELFLYAILAIIPFIFVLVLLSLLYMLVCGFAQMVDDVREIKEQIVPQKETAPIKQDRSLADKYFGPSSDNKTTQTPVAPKEQKNVTDTMQ